MTYSNSGCNVQHTPKSYFFEGYNLSKKFFTYEGDIYATTGPYSYRRVQYVNRPVPRIMNKFSPVKTTVFSVLYKGIMYYYNPEFHQLELR